MGVASSGPLPSLLGGCRFNSWREAGRKALEGLLQIQKKLLTFFRISLASTVR